MRTPRPQTRRAGITLSFLRVIPIAVVLAVAILFPGLTRAAVYCVSFSCEPDYYEGGDGTSSGSASGSTLAVEISSPNSGTSVNGVVPVTASVSGVKKANVNRVEFFVDGVHFGTDLDGQPFKADWNTLDPEYVAYDGSHALTAIAYDNAGRASSPIVNVNVTNTAGTMYQANITPATPVPQAEDFDPNAATQQTYPVQISLYNKSSYAWSPTSVYLYYRWFSPDPTPEVIDGGAVSLGSTLYSGWSRTLQVDVKPPPLENGVHRAQWQLRFDLYNSALGGGWFASKGNQPHENPVIVNKAIVAQALGLERYYHYQGEDVGAGMKHLVNIANGNSILRWTPMLSPGRGLSTVLDLTYNAMEKKTESPVGNNWSLAISSLTRFGNPIDIHPNKADEIAGRANRYVELTDGDGTTHKFIGKQAADGTVYWEEPPGVHLYLRTYSTTDPARKWALTRPDRVTFFYDEDGFPTSVEDKNGNKITFTLETTPPAEDPGGPKKRITKITDAAGNTATPAPNRSYTIDYYSKAEVKAPKVRGNIQSITDHEGHALLFDYYTDGNLLRITQKGGYRADNTLVRDRSFVFTYTVPNGSAPAIPYEWERADPDPRTSSQSTRLFSVRNPRGHETTFTYLLPANANDWKLESRTDRASNLSSFSYDIANRVTTFTAPLNRISKYAYDTNGKVTRITNPKSEATDVVWTSDFHVAKVIGPTARFNGDPAAVSWGANRIDAVVRAPDNSLWHRRFDGTWNAVDSLGGSWTSGAAVASWGPNRLDVFARGADNALWHTWFDGTWHAWESLGGALTSDPAAVSWASGRIDVFVRGTDNALHHKYYSGGAWSGWGSLGGNLASGPAAASWGSGRLDVFARGTDNTLLHKWYSAGWSAWESLGGTITSDPDAVSWESGRIDVVARGGDNAIWHKYYASATGWSAWGSLGGSLASGPAISSWGPGRLDVFARGGEAILWHKTYNGSWGGWTARGIRQFAYNANGYLTDEWDELANRTNLTYENIAADANDVSGKWKAGRTIPHLSQLATKTSPRGTASSTAGDYQWKFAYDAKGNPTTVTDPLGNATQHAYNADGTVLKTVDALLRPTDYQYDANGLVKFIRKPNGSITQFGYDDDGLLSWIQDPNHYGASGTDTRSYQITFDYDAFHRLWRQSAPKSTSLDRGNLIWSGADYDENDNLVRKIDPQEGTYWPGIVWNTITSETTYDVMDRQTLVRGPHSGADPQDERTTYEYDAAGRLVKVTLPEGVASSTVNDWTSEYKYDLLDRVVTATRYPLDGAATGARRTHFCYDLAGDRRWVTSPKAALADARTDCGTVLGVTPPAFTKKDVRDEAHQLIAQLDAENRKTAYAYDADGNKVSQTDPRLITKTAEYDAMNRVTKAIQPFKSGKSLTNLTEYDKVGNVVKETGPRGVDAGGGQYVRRYEYDGADQLLKVLEPTSTEYPAQHYVHYDYDANGNLLWTSLPVTNALKTDVAENQKTLMTYFDPGWIRTSKEAGKPRIRFNYTPQGWQKERVFESNTAKTVTWTYFADGLKKTQTDPKGKPTTYTYDLNNNLTMVDDAGGASDEQPIVVKARYNGFSEIAKISQQKNRQGNWRVTLLGYDANGNTTSRTENREETDPDAGTVATDSSGKALTGRSHTFSYNASDWLTVHYDNGKDAGCEDDRRIITSYLSNGWESQRTRQKKDCATAAWQTQQQTNWTYYLNKQIQTLVTKTLQNGALTQIESHDVLYEEGTAPVLYVGHRTKDTFTRGEAGKPCGQGSPCVQTWKYDARDRLVNWANGKGTTKSYKLDPPGNITREETTGEPTLEFTYLANQLTEVRANSVLVEKWWYKDGNVDCVTSPTGSQADCPAPGSDTANGNVYRSYGFDYLDRMEKYRSYSSGASTDKADYFYDALDRLGKETESHNGRGSRTTEFDHIGITKQVSEEKHTGATGSYQNKTKRYSYDAWGRLAAMQNESSTGTKTDYSYGFDVHGNVSLLINQAGGAQATYGYRPYGELDEQSSDGDKGDQGKYDPANPYRFSAHRYDSGSGTIDMGARRFAPNVSRFIQQDVYMGALEDLSLTLDPLTQNRYALTGGNPVSFVEVDGHFGWDDITDAVSDAADFVQDHAHEALDVCGLVPVVGSACDLGNAALYAAEGDWGNAAMSALGAVPGVGEAATVLKYGVKYGDEAVAGAKALANKGDEIAGAPRQVARNTDEATGGGSRLTSCAVNSFTAETTILLAGGESAAIAEIEVGDEVAATNPKNGKTTARKVTAVIAGTGDKKLVEIRVDGDTITATANHPFFVEGEGGWVYAADLRAGDVLVGPDGDNATVEGIRVYTAENQTVYNLTVAGLHTYHAGRAAVLVHNSGCDPPIIRRKAGGPREGMDFTDAVKRQRREQADKRCVYCGEEVADEAVEVDHGIAKSQGGAGDIDNANRSCVPCNRSKWKNLWPKRLMNKPPAHWYRYGYRGPRPE